MKKPFIVLIGIVAVLFVVFILLRHTAIAPNGQLQNPIPTPIGQGNITVTSPRPGSYVSSSITVTGTERTFEQNVAWQLRAVGGDVLASGNTTGHAPDVGIFGPYSFTITIPSGAPKNLEIVVYDLSAKDGSVIDQVIIPVMLQ